MALTLLFVVDPLAKLKEYKDSTVAMMREAARRGHAIFACTIDELAYSGVVRASVHRLRITQQAEPWYEDLGSKVVPLTEFDAVLIADPAGILAESPRGLNDLYVALTRATQRVGVVHEGELPAVLAGLRAES